MSFAIVEKPYSRKKWLEIINVKTVYYGTGL